MDVQYLRNKLRAKKRLEDEELIFLASRIQEPIRPSDCVDWAEKEAIPLFRELSNRLDAYRRTLISEREAGPRM